MTEQEEPEYPPYPETEDKHFDQLSPLDGVQQQPDGSLAPANPVRPLDVPEDAYAGPVGQREAAVPVVPEEYTAEFQDSVAEQLEKQRAQLAQPAGNVDIQGAPHFMRVVDDVELCGTCGESFPCAGWQAMAKAGEASVLPGVTPMDGPALPLPTFEEAAQALGLTADQLMNLARGR